MSRVREIIKYQALVKSIKPLDQRKDAKGKDTFVCLIGGGATLENFLTSHLCCARR